MLRHGLAASLRGFPHARPTSTLLKNAGASSSRLSFTKTSSLIPIVRLPLSIRPSERLFTTTTNLTARIAPTSRRRTERITPNTSLEDDIALLNSPHAEYIPPAPGPPSISRALLFFLGFSALSFTGAAYYSLKSTSEIASDLRSSQGVFGNLTSFFNPSSFNTNSSQIWGPGVTEKGLMIAKKHETATKLGLQMEWIVGWCNQLHLPAEVTEFVGRSYIICAEKYLDLSPSKQVVLPIVVANTVVYGLWTIASARRGGTGALWRFMNKHFVHRPGANTTHTMVTSVFSHQAFLHYLFNNVALWSIGGSAVIVASHLSPGGIIPEASFTPHFLAFFTTAGVFAATISHIVSAIRFRRIASLISLTAAKQTVGRQGSLGASGAVYSALVMSALAFPDAKLGVIFLPFVIFPIGMGVAGLVAVDIAGIVLGWRMFDHWAHLGGALFGLAYWHLGGAGWEKLKAVLVERIRIGEGHVLEYSRLRG